MRDVDLEPLQLQLYRQAQPKAEGAERLVQQQDHRYVHQGAGARATRCCRPPESWLGRRWANSCQLDDVEHLPWPCPGSRLLCIFFRTGGRRPRCR